MVTFGEDGEAATERPRKTESERERGGERRRREREQACRADNFSPECSHVCRTSWLLKKKIERASSGGTETVCEPSSRSLTGGTAVLTSKICCCPEQ